MRRLRRPLGWLGLALCLAGCAPPAPPVGSDPPVAPGRRAPASEAPAAPAAPAASAPLGVPEEAAAPAAPGASTPLRVHEVAAEPGAPAILLVVLLHGYGARGDDLVPLARSLRVQPGTVFLVPEAPQAVGQGGRAWWSLRLAELRALPEPERRARLESLVPEGLEASRVAVQRVIAEAMARHGLPASRVVVAGFSQGAMLATDVVLHHPERLGGLVVLSGSPIALRRWRERMPSRAGVPVLLAHGRGDSMLPFGGAEALAAELEAAGFTVDTVYFDGGHGIPDEVRLALGRFLTRRASPSGP